jgi:hypothetical protein
MTASRQGSGSRLVRHDAPPQGQTQVHPPVVTRWTRGWCVVLVRMAVRLLTASL